MVGMVSPDIKQLADERHLTVSQAESLHNLQEAAKARQTLKDSGYAADAQEEKEMNLFGSFKDMVELAIASVKYQDPLDPVDVADMTAQFFSVAQALGLSGIKKTLERQGENQELSQLMQVSSQVGKYIEVNGSQFFFGADPNATDEIGFHLPQGVSSVSVQVFDENSNLLNSETLSPPTGYNTMPTGKQFYRWNGEASTSIGQKKLVDGRMEEGLYRIKIVPLNDDGKIINDQITGKPLEISTTVRGRVTGGERQGNKTLFNMNGTKVPISSLLGVHENTQVYHPVMMEEEIIPEETEQRQIARMTADAQAQINDRIWPEGGPSTEHRAALQNALNDIRNSTTTTINQ